MPHSKTMIGLAVLAAVAGIATSASAATALREKVSNATGICQAALPAFDGLIRKRPLAVQNEGTGHAFVTCSLTTDTTVSGGSGTELLILYLINNSAVAKTIDCTAVIGQALRGDTEFFPQSISVAAGGRDGMAWDNDGDGFSSPVNVSCNLPPETGISASYVLNRVNVGN